MDCLKPIDYKAWYTNNSVCVLLLYIPVAQVWSFSSPGQNVFRGQEHSPVEQENLSRKQQNHAEIH